eukprot:gene857-492_t
MLSGMRMVRPLSPVRRYGTFIVPWRSSSTSSPSLEGVVYVSCSSEKKKKKKKKREREMGGELFVCANEVGLSVGLFSRFFLLFLSLSLSFLVYVTVVHVVYDVVRWDNNMVVAQKPGVFVLLFFYGPARSLSLSSSSSSCFVTLTLRNNNQQQQRGERRLLLSDERAGVASPPRPSITIIILFSSPN